MKELSPGFGDPAIAAIPAFAGFTQTERGEPVGFGAASGDAASSITQGFKFCD